VDLITFEQFSAVDIRIGTVTNAEVPAWSHWVMKITADLGEEIGTKVCFSGIMKFFKPTDLIGKQFPFVVNLKPRTIGPDKELSEVMMIMACPGDSLPDEKEAEEVPTVLFDLQKKVANGTKVR
jgi:tRNA-binding EMAP/Myf-like protein